MDENKKLDLVLEMFHKRESDHPTLEQWNKLSQRICATDYYATAFDSYKHYLFSEGYIRRLNEESIDIITDYATTLKGRILLQSQGFTAYAKAQEWNQRVQKIQLWVILVSTFLAACYSVKEILFSSETATTIIHYHIF